jgi:two-component SAPR family response regulator
MPAFGPWYTLLMRPTVLALDDDLAIARLIELTLQDRYEVKVFSQAAAALEALSEGLKPEVILCDVSMPGMTGFAFHEEVRKIGALRSVPFIYLTAMDSRQHFRQGMSLGADDYLTKPFTTDELLDSLATRLGRAESLRQRDDEAFLTIASLGGLEVSLGETRVRWGAKKAAEVFLFLLAAKETVRREQLKKELWWEDIAEGSFRVINSRVRKAVREFADILTDAGRYELALKCQVSWDALDFERRAQAALEGDDFDALREAAQSYGGEFLPGFDSPWAERQRGHFDGLYLELLERSLELAPSEALAFEARRQLESYFERP